MCSSRAENVVNYSIIGRPERCTATDSMLIAVWRGKYVGHRLQFSVKELGRLREKDSFVVINHR